MALFSAAPASPLLRMLSLTLLACSNALSTSSLAAKLSCVITVSVRGADDTCVVAVTTSVAATATVGIAAVAPPSVAVVAGASVAGTDVGDDDGLAVPPHPAKNTLKTTISAITV